MGRPKNSTKYRRINLSKTPTHKRHRAARAAKDRAPGGAKKSTNLLQNNEKEEVWIEYDDELLESAQEEAWSSSSESSSIVLLDDKEEDDSRSSDRLYFDMIHLKEVADWYKSVAEETASRKRPHHYLGNSRMTKWRASQNAKKNGQTILNFFKPTVSTQTQGQVIQC
jgi:hypothetical protein